MSANLKIGSPVVFRQGGRNYHYTLTALYSEKECPEPACRIQNGIGEMICRQSEVEPESEFERRTMAEEHQKKYGAIIEAWNAGLRKTKHIAERLSESDLRSLGQKIGACKRLGLIGVPETFVKVVKA